MATAAIVLIAFAVFIAARDTSAAYVPWTGPAPLNTNAAKDTGDDFLMTFATDGAGTWITVWHSDDDLDGTIGTDQDILYAVSIDNGASWSDPAALNTDAEDDLGDDRGPSIATDGAGTWITVWQSTNHSGGAIGDEAMYFAISTDDGESWSDPELLNPDAGIATGDDRWAKLVTDRAGTWIAAWQSEDDLGGTIDDDWDILYVVSTDEGQSWTDAAPLNTNADEDSGRDGLPALATDGMGTWIATWESNDVLGDTIGDDWDILYAVSIDGGESWSDPAALNTNAATDSGGDFWPTIATDGAGTWITAWYSREDLDGDIGEDVDILYAVSTDDGTSWSDPAPLNANADMDSGDDFDPHLVTDGAGTWIAAWMSNEDLDGAIGDDWDILYAVSTDDGGSWTDPEPLNTNAADDSGEDWDPILVTDGLGNWIAGWWSNDSLDGTIGDDWDILYATAFIIPGKVMWG